MTRHIRLTGTSRAARTAWASQEIGSALVVRCHRRLRGPYTGVDTVLSALLPEASQRWPELVELRRSCFGSADFSMIIATTASRILPMAARR